MSAAELGFNQDREGMRARARARERARACFCDLSGRVLVMKVSGDAG